MRVGILTFHYANNYGAVLQALGLQTALTELGHESVFLDYIPAYMKRRTSALRGWGFASGRRFFSTFSQRLHEQRRRNEISYFRERKLQCSPRLVSKSDLAKYCATLDAVIVGSDQVWNLHWQNNYDDTYFLGFLPKSASNVRRIAYAPCFGQPEQPADLLKNARPHIASFDAIGMRNEFGKDLLETMGITAITRVVDPALLLPVEVKKNDSRKGIVVYAVASSTAALCASIAKQASEHFEQPIFQICSETPVRLPITDLKRIRYANPDDWLNLIKESSFVCSESFHGVVFAMANNVPFIAASNGLRAHRIRDLLAHYRLEQRLIEKIPTSTENLVLPNLGATADISAQLNADIISSKQFLKEALA